MIFRAGEQENIEGDARVDPQLGPVCQDNLPISTTSTLPLTVCLNPVPPSR